MNAAAAPTAEVSIARRFMLAGSGGRFAAPARVIGSRTLVTA
jgi:putative transposon-encoded protein